MRNDATPAPQPENQPQPAQPPQTAPAQTTAMELNIVPSIKLGE
jgi:hypothetical protein